MAASVRERQIAALKRMLDLNTNVNHSMVSEPVWKVLVYDRCGQDIISPIFTIKELRDFGVTVHLQLHSDRDAIPDVPAVYFVMPTDDNIQRICQDFQNSCYDSYYLNFISPISRQKLENLGTAALNFNCVSQITKIYDQYLNFISLEDDLFTLRRSDDTLSFYEINRGDVKDTEMNVMLDGIVDCLFSVFVTLGTVPIIRCPRGDGAEMVAEKLDKKLKENLRDARNSLFTTDSFQSGQFSFQRPVLVILDRTTDLATPLHHTWTYQALVHDVLDLHLNRVILNEDEVDPLGQRVKRSSKTFDLMSSDKLWLTHKGSPFPTVAEVIQEELEQYRSSETEVKKLKTAMGLDGESDEAISMLSDNTAKLTVAVSSLPELLEKKRLLDMHTSIATAILNHIKQRKLDSYFEVEEKIMSKAITDKSLMELIKNPHSGVPEDKMRLFIIAFICGQAMTDVEFDQYSAALHEAGCDLAALRYLKRWKAYSKMGLGTSPYTGGGTKTVNMFSKLMSQGSSFVMEGVKNLVVKKHNLPVTRIVDAVMEQRSLQDTEDFRYFDPKLLRGGSGDNPSTRNKSPFHDAVVFIIGGGNYIEYQNLIDYVKSKTGPVPKRILYGSTSLSNGTQFLKQLSMLGEELT